MRIEKYFTINDLTITGHCYMPIFITDVIWDWDCICDHASLYSLRSVLCALNVVQRSLCETVVKIICLYVLCGNKLLILNYVIFWVMLWRGFYCGKSKERSSFMIFCQDTPFPTHHSIFRTLSGRAQPRALSIRSWT